MIAYLLRLAVKAVVTVFAIVTVTFMAARSIPSSVKG